MGAGVEVSGGSAGNTMAGIASLGGKGAYIGKVRDDQLGERVRARPDRAIGVSFDTPRRDQRPRHRALPDPGDARRAAHHEHLSRRLRRSRPRRYRSALVAAAQVTYLEGYLFDPPRAKEAFRKAADDRPCGRAASLALAVRPVLRRPLSRRIPRPGRDHVDILFANESEICSLYRDRRFRRRRSTRCAASVEIAALTRSEQGSLIVTNGASIAVPAAPVARVVDTTGAGDLYAAGFLYGLTHGKPLAACGRLGSFCAAEIICHVGARPEVKLSRLVAASGPV